MSQWVVVDDHGGGIVDDMGIFGPFPDSVQAIAWAEKYINEGREPNDPPLALNQVEGLYILELQDPATGVTQ